MTDRSGFDCFVHARGAALARAAYLLTGDHHLAEDLAQSALVQAAEHWERTHTSPWREFLLPLPPEPMSFAVDLIPDLDGDPDQGLTYDFVAHAMGDSDGGRAPSWRQGWRRCSWGSRSSGCCRGGRRSRVARSSAGDVRRGCPPGMSAGDVRRGCRG